MISCTLFSSPDGIGLYNPKTGSYSGAIGKVHDGLADMVAVPIYYPLIDPDNEYFDYSNPIREDKMMMACAYNKSVAAIDKDIMAMFSSVDPSFWWATLGGFVTFILLLQFGYKVLDAAKDYKPPAWMVTCAFLFEDNFPEDRPFNRVVNVTACVFLFFFGNYLLNSMSSDLIVYDSPRVITRYQDILDRVAGGEEMKVVIHPLTPEASKFQDALPGAIENKLWQLRAGDVGNTGPGMVMKLVGPVTKQRTMTILREDIVKAIAAYSLLAISGIEEMDDINAFLAIDPDVKKFTNVMAFRKGLDSFSKWAIVRT